MKMRVGILQAAVDTAAVFGLRFDGVCEKCVRSFSPGQDQPRHTSKINTNEKKNGHTRIVHGTLELLAFLIKPRFPSLDVPYWHRTVPYGTD